jgi:hypothetical protein
LLRFSQRRFPCFVQFAHTEEKVKR